MIILDTVNKSLEVILGGAHTTNALTYYTSYTDLTISGNTVASVPASDGTTNGTTAVTMIAVPSAGVSRKVDSISIFNADTVATTVTVRVNSSGSFRNLIKISVPVDYSLLYEANRGFFLSNPFGQQTSAKSSPVVIASDQSFVAAPNATIPSQAVLVAGTDGTNLRVLNTDGNGIQIVSARGSANGAQQATWTSATSLNSTSLLSNATNATLLIGLKRTGSVTDGTIQFIGQDANEDQVNLWGVDTATGETKTSIQLENLSTTVVSEFQINVSAWPNVGVKLTEVIAGAGSVLVTLYDTSMPAPIVFTKDQVCTTPAQTSVAGSALSVTLKAANTSRKGLTVFNDSSSNLFLKLGATASTSSFTARLVPNTYYEVPYGYTGIVDGIWSAATGNARITELT